MTLIEMSFSHNVKNRPFLSSKNSLFQNEAKTKTSLVKMRFICMRIENHFYISGFALSPTLKQKLEAILEMGYIMHILEAVVCLCLIGLGRRHPS